jgi:hypothetical protein
LNVWIAASAPLCLHHPSCMHAAWWVRGCFAVFHVRLHACRRGRIHARQNEKRRYGFCSAFDTLLAQANGAGLYRLQGLILQRGVAIMTLWAIPVAAFLCVLRACVRAWGRGRDGGGDGGGGGGGGDAAPQKPKPTPLVQHAKSNAPNATRNAIIPPLPPPPPPQPSQPTQPPRRVGTCSRSRSSPICCWWT